MSASDPHDDEAALDRLLAKASWEAPSPADEYRLREDWQHLHLRQRRRIGPVLTLAAASVAIAIGAIALLRTEPVTVVYQADPAQSGPKFMVTEPAHVESRPANLFEQLLVMQADPPRAPAPQPVARLHPAVERLIRQLEDPLMQNRFDAARALAQMDQPQVVPILVEMINRDDNRAALAALMLSKTPAAAEALERVRTSRTVEAQCLALAGDAQFQALKKRVNVRGDSYAL